MQKPEIIECNGKQIFYQDFSNCTAEEALVLIREARAMLDGLLPGSMLGLTVVTGGRFDLKVVEELKEFSRLAGRYFRATAVVGISGMQRVILIAVEALTGRKYELFDDVQKAIEWLVRS